MTKDDTQEGGAKAAKADRLKAALKANMGRRKAQARDDAPNHAGRRKAAEDADG